jgi:hypothetical protein
MIAFRLACLPLNSSENSVPQVANDSFKAVSPLDSLPGFGRPPPHERRPPANSCSRPFSVGRERRLAGEAVKPYMNSLARVAGFIIVRYSPAGTPHGTETLLIFAWYSTINCRMRTWISASTVSVCAS